MTGLVRWLLAVGIGLQIAAAAARPALAQETAADTAQILVTVARQLELEGNHGAAVDLARYIVAHFPGTTAAAEATRMISARREVSRVGSGRSQFVVFNTIFATWLGVTIPAALGADNEVPYGLGLLVAAPTGFFASKAYANRRALTSAQAGAYSLAAVWLTWQALGWQGVLEIGQQEICYEDPPGSGQQYCYTETKDEAPFTAMVLGGLAGIGTGLALTRLDIAPGTATLADHAAIWGTAYGIALGALFDAQDDGLLTWTLLGGDAGLALTLPLAAAWRPTSSQVRLTSVAGLAGAAVGGGLDLLFDLGDEPNEEDAAILLPMATSAAGLLAGALLTRESGMRAAGRAPRREGLALVNGGGHWALSLPTPLPGVVPMLTPDGRVRPRPALRLRLFEAWF